ncbi:MAG TPA: D-glucuronyl C5-epimerase family protein, partial [Gaiellaceae bacterium]|nr:D-glucuronyl C5-epimerase family protein [Gaiellaceae bacterium]
AAIKRQVARGHISPADAARYRSAVNRAALLARELPRARSAPLESQLAQAAAIAPKLTAPRALAVFTQLEINDNWFARHSAPPPQTDVTDADGVVYRYFAGKGFEFHPLASFGALNAVVASKNAAATARLANALLERGVPEPGGVGWEYYFDFGGGKAPWLSGFAQAVAAQAFARAAALDTADTAKLTSAARAAFRIIPGRLDQQTRFGPWIKLYSFNHAVVLNAQLQSEISLASYAKSTSDSQAAALAASMKQAAARALPSFHTPYWSYYQLPSEPSPQSYQAYVVQLLQSLSPSDPRFAAAATEFGGFETQPPQFKLADSPSGAVHFWVSKPSTVRIAALGGDRRLSVSGGWHTVSWKLPARAGIFPVTIHATDWAGNAASAQALPIVRVVKPPKTTKRHVLRETAGAAAALSLPALSVGAGLGQPEQASLAAQQGLGSVLMTLIWPAGASAPDPNAIAALNRLPQGTSLVLDLYAEPLPSDDPGRAALASYAAAVAQQVPALHDLVLEPSPAAVGTSAYEAALGAIYDAVKPVAPAVRVDGALDGSQAPAATLAALAAAYRTSSRTFPLMDGLVFTPAPAAGKNLWALGDVSKLTAALNSRFSGTAQPGASLPLIIAGVAADSEIPAAELALYESPIVGTTGVDEPSQAAAYVAALKAVACKPTVVGLLFDRLIDGTEPGEQSGLFYPDETPKTSLQAVAQAIATAESATRGCGVTTPPATAPGSTTTTTTPAQPPAPGSTNVAALDELSFPTRIEASSAPNVQVGCTSACLYLVTMQRAGDAVPVLARRGAIARAGAKTVTLPDAPFPAGDYRFSVWIVAQSNPGTVAVERSQVVTAT